MFGFWFGINLVLPFVAIYWLIKPDFLFYKKPLARPQIALIISIIIFIDMVLLVLMATSPKQVNDGDVIGFFIGVIVFFGFGAWRFYRYGQYSILSKLANKPTPIINPNPPIIIKNNPTDNNTNDSDIVINNINLSQDKIETTPQMTQIIETPLPSQNTSDNQSTPTNQSEQDWQAYKQRMEQSWQETRTKLTQKSRGK